MIKLKQRTAADLPPWTWFFDDCDRQLLAALDRAGNKIVLIPGVGSTFFKVTNPSSIVVTFVPEVECPKLVSMAADLQTGTWFLDEEDQLCVIAVDNYFGTSSSRRERVIIFRGSHEPVISYARVEQVSVKRIVLESELEFCDEPA